MWDFPCSSLSKESACHAGDPGLNPGLGRFPGEGKGNPLQYSCLENPMDWEAWLQSMGLQRVRHNWVTSHFPLPNNQKNLEKEKNVTTNSVIMYKLTKFNWMCLSGPMFVIRVPTWVHTNYMCISCWYPQAVPLKTVDIVSKHCTISATLWVKLYF